MKMHFITLILNLIDYVPTLFLVNVNIFHFNTDTFFILDIHFHEIFDVELFLFYRWLDPY